MKWFLTSLIVLGAAQYAVAQRARCGSDTLDQLAAHSGFEIIATCEIIGVETHLSIAVRRRAVAETPSLPTGKELRRLKISLTGTLVAAEAPAGYRTSFDVSEQPKRVSIIWSRTEAARGAVEDGSGGFTVTLAGDGAAISCPHEFATDTIVGGVICGIPAKPGNTRVDPTAGNIVAASTHSAAAAHARRR